MSIHSAFANKKRKSATAIRLGFYVKGLKFALMDGLYAAIVVGFVVLGAMTIRAIWTGVAIEFVNGFGLALKADLLTKALFTLAVLAPTLAFLRTSIFNLKAITSDPKSLEREMVDTWDRLAQNEASAKEGN